MTHKEIKELNFRRHSHMQVKITLTWVLFGVFFLKISQQVAYLRGLCVFIFHPNLQPYQSKYQLV